MHEYQIAIINCSSWLSPIIIIIKTNIAILKYLFPVKQVETLLKQQQVLNGCEKIFFIVLAQNGWEVFITQQ